MNMNQINKDAIRKRKRRGQGATEYIIILVLVAIGSISVITVFGDQVRELFNAATKGLQGQTDYEVEKFDASDKVQQDMGMGGL